MGEWDWAFFYNEDQNNVESVTTYHQLDCDMGSLAEAHPEVIYFYAEFSPLKEWDFNEYAGQPTLFDTGVDHAQIFLVPGGEEIDLDFSKARLLNLSLDKEPNAFGETIHIVQDGQESELHRTDLWEKQNDAFRVEGSRPPTPDE